MRVFVAGASGALGAQLVPKLVAAGHEVVAMTRTASKQDGLRALGARAVVADALDPDAVARVVGEAEPEVIVHELTALSGKMSIRDARHPDRSSMAKMTNRLRTEGTDHLLAAGRAVGARRFVAQSFGAFRYARTGGSVQTEADPLDPDPPAPLRPVVEGLLYLEDAVTTIDWGEGLALRYGGFYGPGTSISLAPDAQMAAPIRKRRFPIVGDGGASRLSSTSRTPRWRPSPRLSAASRVSITSSTTSPRPCGSGCRCWRARWVPSRQGVSRAGPGGWWPVRRPRW
jgi:2-alkyl-3-oxoalkanoate reductase